MGRLIDREKVIKGMEQFRSDFKPFCGGKADWEKFDAGLALLKEQEADGSKQIIRKQCKKEHDDGSIDYFAEWYCPHCNMLILRGFDNPSIKFCYKCGKPVLWEDR